MSIGSDTPETSSAHQHQQVRRPDCGSVDPGVQSAASDLADCVDHHQQCHGDAQEPELGKHVDEEVVSVGQRDPARA